MQMPFDVLVVGAGQAGLAIGHCLQHAGLHFLILDAKAEIGGSWHDYWDSVTLFSPARYSGLHGLPFPGERTHYPTRREMIAYLQQYAAHFELPFMGNARVQCIQRQPDGVFSVRLADRRMLAARAVVTATGPFTKAYVPELPGQQDFAGQQLHASVYHRPEPFSGQRIIVVGSHNSAVQIGAELAQIARVTLAVRKAIRFTPLKRFGIHAFDLIHGTGFDMLQVGCRFNLCESSAVYDDGTYKAAFESGNPDVRPMFRALTPDGVRWADDTDERVDTVIYATGFDRRNLPYLTDTGALDANGLPLHHRGASTTVPGLFYLGLEGQIAPASATIRGVSRDARVVMKGIRQYLAATPLPHPTAP